MADGAIIPSDNTEKTTVHDLAIEGMTCASCVARVEKSIARVPGVESVTVNLATESAHVEASAPIDDAALIAAVSRAGYGARPKKQAAPARADRDRRERVILAVAALGSLPLLLPMLSLGHVAIPVWLAAVLGTIVQFGPGWSFYVSGAKSLKAGAGSMDLLVALGTSAAYGLSLFDAVSGTGPLYFEASAVVIALVRFGRYLETRAKRKAAQDVGALAALRPAIAHRIEAGLTTDIPAETLRLGDIIEIRPGERIPADSRILDGAGLFDEQHITGESMPVAHAAGDKVMAGALAQDAVLRLEVTAPPGQSMIDRMASLIEAAQASKPPIQRLADQIASWFVPAVLIIALGTVCTWLLLGFAASQAIIAAVSVLVIACPCALGLATPAAIVTGTGIAARHGILLRDAAVLEQAHRIDTVVFDKTGTLTEGKPQLVAALPATGMTRAEILAAASSLSASGTHPIAHVLREAAPDAEPATGMKIIGGRGVTGEVGDVKVRLGNAAFAHETGTDPGALEAIAADMPAGSTISYLFADGGSLLGALGFADPPRATSRAAVDAIRAQGCDIVLLTGDRAEAAQPIADALGITEIFASADPEQKSAKIAELRASGRNVAMVGDGINDAAALARADLGIAIGSGVDSALDAAPIVLLRDDPRLIADAIRLARRVRQTLLQGFFWALIYNIVGIPLAAIGLLNPMVAGAAMAASSVSVLANALRLRLWNGLAR